MTNIVDDIDAVVALARGAGATPYYIYGHNTEINQRLLEKDKDKVFKYQKYPLIALRLDVGESNLGNGLTEFNLNVGIFAMTKPNYTSAERKVLVFDAVLQPLYDSFIEKLRTSGIFVWAGHPIPQHDKFDRYFWGTGTEQGNVKQIFDDPLDCIEIVNLKIKKRNC